MLIDCSLVENIKLDNYEVAVIGGGTSGINLVSELLKNRPNTKICLIESGGFNAEEKVNHLDSSESDLDKIDFSRSIARYFGGKSNLWDGRIVPLDEDELGKWPIDNKELYFWINKSLKILGIKNISIDNLINKSNNIFINQKLGKLLSHKFDVAPAFFSQEIKRFNMNHLKEFNPIKSLTFDIFIHANAMKLHRNKNNNLISNVELRDSLNHYKKPINLKAKYFVICSGGIETVKILLNSTKGLANSSQMLGLNFSGHPRGIKGIIKLNKSIPIKSIHLNSNVNNKSFVKSEFGLKLKNNYKNSTFVKSRIVLNPVDFAFHNKLYYLLKPNMAYMRNYLEENNINPYGYLKGFFYLLFSKISDKLNLPRKTKYIYIRNYLGASLNKKSKIYFKKELIEEKSLKIKCSIDWQISKEDKESLVKTHNTLDEILRENSIGYLKHEAKIKNWRIWGGSSHFMSTTVMSEDPNKGIVNKDCKSHDHKNLYISGPNVFPTPSYANPMLMIVAISLRLGKEIADTLNKDEKNIL